MGLQTDDDWRRQKDARAMVKLAIDRDYWGFFGLPSDGSVPAMP
jgi:hypothetical protein